MFKNRGMHFIHLNVNSLIPKIEEIRHLAKLTNASVIDTSEIKLDGSVLNNEVAIEGYDVIKVHRSRKGGGVACFIKHSVTCICNTNMTTDRTKRLIGHVLTNYCHKVFRFI